MNITTDDYLIQQNNGWSDFGEPVSKSDLSLSDDLLYVSDTTPNTSAKVRKSSTGCIVLTIQLVICLVVLTMAFITKTFYGENFEQIKSVFDNEIRSSLFYEGKLKNDDYSSIFINRNAES